MEFTGYNSSFKVIFLTYESFLYTIAWIVNTVSHDSSTVFYPFSNKWWGVFKANTFKPFVFLKHGDKMYNFDISISTWSPSAIEVLSRAGMVSVGLRLSLDLLTAAKWLYQSLLPSPELSGEGAAFPEVSDGKRYSGVSEWFRKVLPKPCVVWETQTLLLVWELRTAERTCCGLHPCPS